MGGLTFCAAALALSQVAVTDKSTAEKKTSEEATIEIKDFEDSVGKVLKKGKFVRTTDGEYKLVDARKVRLPKHKMTTGSGETTYRDVEVQIGTLEGRPAYMTFAIPLAGPTDVTTLNSVLDSPTVKKVISESGPIKACVNGVICVKFCPPPRELNCCKLECVKAAK